MTSDNECKVCGNTPDAEGVLRHGRGCYVISEDGGGEEYFEANNQAERVEVPELPSGVRLPLHAVGNSFGDMYHLGASLWTSDQAKFLADLINAVYLPGGLRDRLEKAEAMIKKLEEQLKTR